MMKKFHLTRRLTLAALAIFMFLPGLGWGQILTFEFSALAGDEVSAISNSNDVNLTSSTITRGAGLTATTNGGRFNAESWALTSIDNAVIGNDYMEFTISPNSGYQFSVSSIYIQLQRSATGPRAIALRSSVDNYATNLDIEYSISDITTTQNFTFTFAQSNSTTAVTYRLYKWAEALVGSGGIGDGSGNDIIVNGSVTASGGGLTPPTLTADNTLNDVDHDIDITFTDDATWRAAIATVKIGGSALIVTTDYVITSGNLQLKPSGLNALLTTSGSKTVTIEASGYLTASVIQLINAGAATKLGITTQPTAPSNNGGTLATQPVIVIQDQYGNTTTSTADVVAAVGAGAWTIGGTTTKAGVNGTATFTNLTATSSIAITGATINFSSSSLTGIISNSFNIPEPSPLIAVGSLTGFGNQIVNTTSVEKTYDVSGSNLTADIIITPPGGFLISTTSGSGYSSSPITLTQSGGTVSTTPIYVVFNPTAVQAYSGNITHESTGASAQNVAISGAGICAAASFPFVEDFDYTNASLLTANCWTAHSGAGANPIAVQTSSITYPGYLSSGIGNEITLVTGAGEDVNRTFAAQSSGDIYASFMVNVSSASATGDYFFHLGQTNIGSAFRGRIFVKKDGSDNLAFGIAQSNTPVNYTPYSYALNTTYLVVLRFNIVSGSANDVSSIYINPVLNAPEPSVGWITNTDAAGPDLTEVGSVALRQGDSSTDPALKLDGIRISTNWEDIVGTITWPTESFWIGATSSDWFDPSNWGNTPFGATGYPIATTNVIIDAVSVNYNPTISASASCANILIKNGASLLDDGFLTVNGTSTVERTILADEWHLISAPVSGALSDMFTGKFLQKHTESTNAYTDVTSLSEPLTPVKGFALYTAVDYTAQFIGTLNTGTKTFDVTSLYSGVDQANNKGWNLVGNPYPSSINWDEVAVPTGIDDAIYKHINNASWATYIGGVGIPDNTEKYIASCQGFFVRATDAATLTFGNTSRVHFASAFYKNSEEDVSNMIRLEVSGNGYADQAVVRFLPEASSGFDGNFDAYKLFGEIAEAAQLYSLGNTPLAINALPETSLVPVGLRVGASGTYTIAATEIKDLNYVTLEDTKTGIFTDLAVNPYTFTFVPGETEQRFVLHFSALSIDDKESVSANIYSYQKTMYITMKEKVKGDIFVYNISGQLVATKTQAQGMNEIKLRNSGNYIVKVITKENTLVKKVFIQ